MSDWIADNEHEYISKAIGFSENLEQLSKIRKGLISKTHKSCLFNASLFAEEFSKTIWQIWKKFNNK